jgi:hypothetical protein
MARMRSPSRACPARFANQRNQHISFVKLDDERDPFYDRREANRLHAQARAKLFQLLTGVPCPGKEKEEETEETSEEEDSEEEDSEEEPVLVPAPDS